MDGHYGSYCGYGHGGGGHMGGRHGDGGFDSPSDSTVTTERWQAHH